MLAVKISCVQKNFSKRGQQAGPPSGPWMDFHISPSRPVRTMDVGDHGCLPEVKEDPL